MTGTLSSNASLPPLDPFTLDDETYRPPQIRRLGVDATAPELRALLGPDAIGEDDTRPNRPWRAVVLVEGEDGLMAEVVHA